jgi:DNA replication protein DnaC
LFEVVAARFEIRSTVLFTNRSVREWCNLFEMDNILPTALIDRLMQYEEAIVIQGARYRMRDNATQRVTRFGTCTFGGVFYAK